VAGRPPVYVTNWRQLQNYLAEIGDEDTLNLIQQRLVGVGESVVAPKVRSLIPPSRERWDDPNVTARNSVRVRASQTVRSKRGNLRAFRTVYVYVRTGKGRLPGPVVPYFGWLDWGGTLQPSGGRRNTITRPALKTGRYLYPAAYASSKQVVRAAGAAMVQALRVWNRG